jgi:hypothetical protein
MKSKEQKLYDLLNTIVNESGELLKGDLHILVTDQTFRLIVHDLRSFRVYHKKGFCFDVSKDMDDNDQVIYSFFCEWPGFDFLSVFEAIELIKKATS